MKTLILTALTVLLTNIAFASVEVPTYPNSSCDKHVCASISRSTRGGMNRLNVQNLKTHLSGNVKMGIIIDESEAIYVNGENSRGGKTYSVNIAQQSSRVSVFFVNDMGQFDSDFGRNFNFVVSK